MVSLTGGNPVNSTVGRRNFCLTAKAVRRFHAPRIAADVVKRSEANQRRVISATTPNKSLDRGHGKRLSHQA